MLDSMHVRVWLYMCHCWKFGYLALGARKFLSASSQSNELSVLCRYTPSNMSICLCNITLYISVCLVNINDFYLITVLQLQYWYFHSIEERRQNLDIITCIPQGVRRLRSPGLHILFRVLQCIINKVINLQSCFKSFSAVSLVPLKCFKLNFLSLYNIKFNSKEIFIFIDFNDILWQ